MVEFYVGDPYFMDRDRRDNPPVATVVPFAKGVTYETAAGLTERFMHWVVSDGGKARFAMTGPVNIMLSRSVEFGHAYPVSRFAEDGLFSTVVFVCDEADGVSPTEDDVFDAYSRVADACIKGGITSISVPLLFENSGINNNKIAKVARAVFREADVECMLYITPGLMAKVMGRG